MSNVVVVEFSPTQLMANAKKAVLALAMFAGITVMAHCGKGCMPAQAPTDLEQSYTTEIVACAATAGYPGDYDRAADMRCRHEVDCRYGLGGVDCPDAGR